MCVSFLVYLFTFSRFAMLGITGAYWVPVMWATISDETLDTKRPGFGPTFTETLPLQGPFALLRQGNN